MILNGFTGGRGGCNLIKFKILSTPNLEPIQFI